MVKFTFVWKALAIIVILFGLFNYTNLAKATNLVINGDFEQGNIGFTTGYTYSPDTLGPAETYTVDYNPHSVHPSFTSYGDHTTGTGKMMIINASVQSDITIWEQTVPVQRNNSYEFSFYCASAYPMNPAIIECYINGTLLGNINLPSSTGNWIKASYTWDSNQDNTATIRLVDARHVSDGDDFTLDDICLDGVPPNEINVIGFLQSTDSIVCQIKGGFGKPPDEWIWEQLFTGPIPDKDSFAGNWITTSDIIDESITETGELPGRPVPVLTEASLLGKGQPLDMDVMSLYPFPHNIYNWYTWLTNLRDMHSDPAPEDLRQRSLLTGVNGKIRIVDSIARDINLNGHFEFGGIARGYGVGPTMALVTSGLMNTIKTLSGEQISNFEKILYAISNKFVQHVAADDAIGYDARFRAKAGASVCFGNPINNCFDCLVITPDGRTDYQWQGGDVSEISSGPVWKGIDFQLSMPTNQDIPLLFELMTEAETAGYAYGGASIARYRLIFTCPEIPEFGTYILDSDDYFPPAPMKVTSKLAQADEQVLYQQGASFGDTLISAAEVDYLRTGLVTTKESFGGITSPKEDYPFAFIEGTEHSGLMFKVKVPKKPKKLVLLFDIFANRAITPEDDVNVDFGLVNSEQILWVKNLEPWIFDYNSMPEPNGTYSLHTGWQKVVMDISNVPPGEAMFCLSVDSSQGELSFGLAPCDIVIISEPSLSGDIDANGVVDFTDLAILANHWLQNDCNYPDWCEGADIDFESRIDFTDFAILANHWFWENIPTDFDLNGTVDFVDFSLFASQWVRGDCNEDNYWCEETDFNLDGHVTIDDLFEFAKTWLK
jgi:hypothetical protein